jgi:glyoxylase-like metal-dependent hydrolase (beta-lactamase superfamily II)
MRKLTIINGLQVLLGTITLGCAVAQEVASTIVAEEFCLQGEFNLGARLQGLAPHGDESYPSRFCVVTQGYGGPVHFRGEGKSNPDMDASFAVSYLPPDTVRIDTGDDAPDIVFEGASQSIEALRNFRIDPRRLVEELENRPGLVLAENGDGWLRVRYPGDSADTAVKITGGRLRAVRTQADLPLRGRVPVNWDWNWQAHGGGEPSLELTVDGVLMFKAKAERRRLGEAEARTLWQPRKEHAPRLVPGNAWPSTVDMQMETLADGVHLVSGVRTGFNHLVVETEEGLVVADAPAGWVEIHQLPPADLVPGLGISGLSEQFIDFLRKQLPGRPLRAVALTHAHDDHAGGARAFAAEGASVYAPSEVAEFLSKALNRLEMPADRLTARSGSISVEPVYDQLILEDADRQVVLVSLGPNPHVNAALGIWVPSAGIFFQSDLHVPHSDSEAPGKDRALTECWFANWAIQSLPEDTLVLNSHSGTRTPINRLKRYTTSAVCTES